MDDEDLPDFDFDDDDYFSADEPETEDNETDEQPANNHTANNRAFLIGVAVLAGVFVVALVCVMVILLTRQSGPSELDLTNTAIAQAYFDTATADAATQTAIAMFTDSPKPTETFTTSPEPTASPTEEPSPTPEPPTQTPTETPAAEDEEEVEGPTPTQEAADAALADAGAEQAPEAVVEAGESEEFGIGGPDADLGPLPDTGITDDLGLGTAGLMLAGVGAVGLLSTIYIARRLRKRR